MNKNKGSIMLSCELKQLEMYHNEIQKIQSNIVLDRYVNSLYSQQAKDKLEDILNDLREHYQDTKTVLDTVLDEELAEMEAKSE
jgi:23S rRNA U2552 (ribose-2'-O)-methylase RlmE/FtsJ